MGLAQLADIFFYKENVGGSGPSSHISKKNNERKIFIMFTYTLRIMHSHSIRWSRQSQRSVTYVIKRDKYM